jgi:heme/copper-type cytochrome/quinol oxidase subunit 2
MIPSTSATKFTVTSYDVLHSFTLLSTGIKVDAILGRANDFSALFLRDGIFFGQCSELCGTGHFGMPVVSEVLDPFFYNDFFQYTY